MSDFAGDANVLGYRIERLIFLHLAGVLGPKSEINRINYLVRYFSALLRPNIIIFLPGCYGLRNDEGAAVHCVYCLMLLAWMASKRSRVVSASRS